jgi:hypothetical protein
MNWEYISGFFDADGSVTLSKLQKNKNKTVVISFHNNEKTILESIQEFILKETNVKGFITHKKQKKENHNDSYSLNYSYIPKVIELIKFMNVLHPKKKHRFEIIKKLKDVTKRNGKYTEEELKNRYEIEELFWLH